MDKEKANEEIQKHLEGIIEVLKEMDTDKLLMSMACDGHGYAYYYMRRDGDAEPIFAATRNFIKGSWRDET